MIKYYMAIGERGHYEMIVRDLKRKKDFSSIARFSKLEDNYSLVNKRAMWNEDVMLTLWAFVDKESPDTLLEAHELGWVNAIVVHRYAQIQGYFNENQRQTNRR